ncbi:TetR/AcrR family transcriptional repressor of mexCD-oprJ operon [Pseudarthrobacter sp. W1I19]|uniref:TetR/AcrR family transcriptional regulator n=1 Tax=Pseudarthrobacter sp. W1I19 TaxID=3042288 RepID=UPI00278B2AA4|nr:TetR/AcrR family transcriptional regulator [Pseudarthrobacter sp. W1I19]MDQ0925677.1 TetR/AcrR family transcriptional repressor of mexCD-oprJ operon [Pseudarthrobacter sp. W1I19]
MPEVQKQRNKRADAVRNRDAIIDAGLKCLSHNPAASMSEIARVAGVGRVTLYGHFTTREDLVSAVFEATMDRAESEVAAVNIDQDTWTSLNELVESSWLALFHFNALLAAAEPYLLSEQIRAHHDKPLAPLIAVLQKGRSEGAFRSDHTLEWQVACFYAILHSAAAEIRAGRLREADAPKILPTTVRALLSSPARMART